MKVVGVSPSYIVTYEGLNLSQRNLKPLHIYYVILGTFAMCIKLRVSKRSNIHSSNWYHYVLKSAS